MPCSNLAFLVVEDHEFQRVGMVQLLKTLGAQAIYSANDGRSALQVLRDPDRPVDIVVSDLSMPGMDGMELIRHLSETGARVSLILASALEPALLASIASMAQAYKVKLLGVIGKPPTAGKLVPLVELHRAREINSASLDSAFSREELVEAWTHGEFEPWYEPKVDLSSGQVRGMHVTPRWRHSTRGVLAPYVFMPSMQARGLNDDFAWLMLQKSVAQCRQWLDQGLHLSLAVNLSFGSLADAKLAARVRQIAENEGLNPGCLVLGMTEEALNTEQAEVLETVARLRVDGFGLAIDDFGSGSMAIEQLAQVAFTELKIKRSFVTGVDQDDAARAGLAIALDLARQLKLLAVADGISSKEDWKLLLEWGCDLGQGPFMSEPLPADAVPRWVAHWKGPTIQ